MPKKVLALHPLPRETINRKQRHTPFSPRCAMGERVKGKRKPERGLEENRDLGTEAGRQDNMGQRQGVRKIDQRAVCAWGWGEGAPGPQSWTGDCTQGSSPVFPLPRSKSGGGAAGARDSEGSCLLDRGPSGHQALGTGRRAMATGWGRDDGQESVSEHLGEVQVPVI